MKKKFRYPEYINGIKQVQCPFRRFCIKIWYSDWFRLLFIICPIWLFALMIVLFVCFPDAAGFIRDGCIASYIVLFIAGLSWNDYSNLRRIGLDEYHQPLLNSKENITKN